MNSEPTILICQHLTCRKQGAAKVLAGFKKIELTGVSIEGCGCLGRCGNGPNVLTLPDRTWYDRVLPEHVESIAYRYNSCE